MYVRTLTYVFMYTHMHTSTLTHAHILTCTDIDSDTGTHPYLGMMTSCRVHRKTQRYHKLLRLENFEFMMLLPVIKKSVDKKFVDKIFVMIVGLRKYYATKICSYTVPKYIGYIIYVLNDC